MPRRPPSLIAIDRDDYHAEHIGRTADGRQFFLTTPFEPAVDGKAGCDFVALFLFDSAGTFLEAKIESLGPRTSLDGAKRDGLYAEWLSELGDVSFERIEISPFSVAHFGTIFGLVPRRPEEDGDDWWVELQPGNYMAFHEPWDSGEYDT